jgi:poly(A) polymerase
VHNQIEKRYLKAEWIDPYALRIIQNLQKRGFQAFLVGGCVRDLLAGVQPKDFDIATNALPEEARRCIPNSYVIGKRFKLVLAKRGADQFEVATFRRSAREEEMVEEGVPVKGDNFFGSCEEDAVRRDFTINALFYDPISHEMVDHVSGLEDIDKRMVRMIGDPEARLLEDPIRILRAVRLSHKLNFTIEPNLRQAIAKTHSQLAGSALPRKREEYLKILKLESPSHAFIELEDLGVLQTVLPYFAEFLSDPSRREVFFNYLDQLHLLTGPDNSAEELVSALLFSMLRAQFPDSVFNLDAIESNQGWDRFIKTELNAFKTEIIEFYKTLSLLNTLEKVESFRRKGPRRQKALLSNPAFKRALRWAFVDKRLSYRDLLFWFDLQNS